MLQHGTLYWPRNSNEVLLKPREITSMLVTKSLMSREDSSSEEASPKMSRATRRIFIMDGDVDCLLSVNDGSGESVTC